MNHKRKKPKAKRSKNAWVKAANNKGRGQHVPERQAVKQQMVDETKGDQSGVEK